MTLVRERPALTLQPAPLPDSRFLERIQRLTGLGSADNLEFVFDAVRAVVLRLASVESFR